MLVITYDEHGGFYDHVIPPVADILARPPGPGSSNGGLGRTLELDPGGVSAPPSGSADPNGGGGQFIPSTMFVNYGVRVPTFVVSPWAPVGKGPDLVLDFCSILKTILARFLGASRPFISSRVEASLSLDAYLSEAEPRLDVPESPEMQPLIEATPPGPAIITEPISRKQMRSGNVDYHDLTGFLARLLGR
jgi:phospholipase C